jgi:hypothetical protein
VYHKQENPNADDHKKREKVNLEAPNPSRRRINLIATPSEEPTMTFGCTTYTIWDW